VVKFERHAIIATDSTRRKSLFVTVI